jgi:hypothetical protein
MKPKKFHKKLNLKKQTIADLNPKEMIRLNGGIDATDNTLPLCCAVTSNCTACCPTDCTCGGTNEVCPCISRKG